MFNTILIMYFNRSITSCFDYITWFAAIRKFNNMTLCIGIFERNKFLLISYDMCRSTTIYKYWIACIIISNNVFVTIVIYLKCKCVIVSFRMIFTADSLCCVFVFVLFLAFTIGVSHFYISCTISGQLAFPLAPFCS